VLAANQTPPKLTAWEQADVGRLTIEWANTTRVRQKKSDDQLVLRFVDPLPSDFGGTAKKISRFIDPDRTKVSDRDLVLTLRRGVTADVTIRQKRIVTIDFERDPSLAPDTMINVSAIENGVRLTLGWPGPTNVVSTSDKNELRLQITPERKIDPAKIATLQTSLNPWLSHIRLDQSKGGRALIIGLQSAITPAVRSDGLAATIVELTRTRAPLPIASPPSSSTIFIPKKRPNPSADAPTLAEWIGPPIPKPRPSREPIGPIAQSSNAQAQSELMPKDDHPDALIFDWQTSVGAAAFLRAGYLWVVFNEPDRRLLREIPKPPPSFGEGAFVTADGGTALRFRMKMATDILVTRTDDGHWRIAPTSDVQSVNAMSVERIDDLGTLRVTPALSDQIVSMIDPMVGDQIDALPLPDPGISQPATRRFVSLQLLPTFQGLAWRPLNDGLNARVEDKDLFFSPPQPTTSVVMKAPAPKQPQTENPSTSTIERQASRPARTASRRSATGPEPSSSFAFADSGVERPLVPETRRILRQAVRRAPPENRNRARLKLARFLVSERLGSEARTVLDAISDDAAIDIQKQRRALLGAAAYVVGHLDEASDLIGAPDLQDDEEIDVWRAALQSRQQVWSEAAESWRKASETLDRYPPRLRLDLGLLAIEAAIETNDDTMIRRGFRRLKPLTLTPLDEARVMGVEALKSERAGDLEAARSMFKKLARSPYQRIRALAEFQLADLDLKEDADPREVLTTLNDRLALWRGHPNERDILNQLAQRFNDADAFRQALRLWRRLIDHHPEAGEDATLAKLRQETFIRALTGTTEAVFEIADPYAIYLDFVDLLPKDPEAREIHRHLAKHLIDLDLAEEAIDVLQRLMSSSQNDAERMDFAIKIASLMLQERRPDQALALLTSAAESKAPLSAPLLERMRLTTSRVLSDLDRTDDALLELKGLQSQTARRLRAEILWEAKRWQQLAASIESYFADDEPASSLSEAEQQLAVWLALARNRVGTPSELRDLRLRFGDAMRDGPHADLFDVATQGLPEANDIPTLLENTERQLSELQRFRSAVPANP
jgi:tetratricopeptide (TPR) repeat protein